MFHTFIFYDEYPYDPQIIHRKLQQLVINTGKNKYVYFPLYHHVTPILSWLYLLVKAKKTLMEYFTE